MSAARLGTPRALLLDFGGVVVESARQPDWPAELAGHIHRLVKIHREGGLTPEDIEVDIRSARLAHRAWKNAMSRPYAPRETTYEEFWRDYVAADWPAPARAYVVSRARDLCTRMVELEAERKPRNGIHDLLATATDSGIPCAIVSNALVGEVHRQVVRDNGLDTYFQTQVYSDEIGLRKPNPELIHVAARALDIPATQSWYVGDHFDRDVVCGRRAGVQAAVLMVANATFRPPYPVRQTPDAVVDDPVGLLALLRTALASKA